MDNLVSYLSLATAVAFVTVVFLAYLKLRGVSNGLLVLAGEEFHDKVDSILKSADELPDSVLDFIEFMIKVANSSNGHWRALRAFRRQNALGREESMAEPERKAAFEKDLGGLRPELRQLVNDTTMMWLNWHLNRNVVSGLLMMFELRRMALGHGTLEPKPIDVERALTPRQIGFC